MMTYHQSRHMLFICYSARYVNATATSDLFQGCAHPSVMLNSFNLRSSINLMMRRFNLYITIQPFTQAAPGLIASLGIALFILVVLLITVIESTVLQLMRWGDFRQSLRGAFWMNAASSLVGLTFLLLIPRYGRGIIVIGWAITIVIEALVLRRLQPELKGRNWWVAGIANLASYLILIVPATVMAD